MLLRQIINFRHMYDFDYIAVSDIDELIVPADPAVLSVPKMLDILDAEGKGKDDSFFFLWRKFPPTDQDKIHRQVHTLICKKEHWTNAPTRVLVDW